MEWLLSPIDPARAHDVGALVAWHARLMVLAWAILIPTGVLAARYFKIMPGQNWPETLDNPAWWYSHRGLQYTGGILTFVAVGLILTRNGGARFGGVHALLGWAVALTVITQFLGGWLRGSKGGPTAPAPDGSLRGDHYDMTRRRLIFEHLHKSVGYLALLIAAAAIVSGLWTANAPVWMWLVIGCWWLVFITLFVAMQRRGMAMDTYEAIWGPDLAHPGNARRPIGWGIRRMGQR